MARHLYFMLYRSLFVRYPKWEYATVLTEDEAVDADALVTEAMGEPWRYDDFIEAFDLLGPYHFDLQQCLEHEADIEYIPEEDDELCES